VLDCPLSITDPSDPVMPGAGAPRGELVFDHVGFAYPDASSNVVSDVSFSVGSGSTLGIVGSTGSGKSTLIQLIPRLYDVTEGSVLLDGGRRAPHAPRRPTLARWLRAAAGEALLGYHRVQRRLFRCGHGRGGRMPCAWRISQSEEFVSRMPDGAESPIAQGGSNISGGQRQRLAIARALAAHPEVLVLDDSFSALDYATDAALRRALSQEETDATIVVVAQRVASVMHADRIVVLDEGRVVGDGTHEELLHTCPAYREIAMSQLSSAELGLEAEVVRFVPAGPDGGEE